MRYPRGMKFAAMAAVLALSLTACGGSDDGDSASSDSSSAASTLKIGLAYDIGGRGDKSFNDAAAAGLEKAKSELGLETKELEAKAGETDAQKEERLRLLASGGYDTIVAVGFAYAGPLKKVAAEFPKVHFAIIDDNSFMADNVANLVFAANEGSFLVGAAAALKSKTAHVGYIGGVQTPLLEVFQAGFDAGAKAVNPSIKIDDKYLTQIPDVSGFASPPPMGSGWCWPWAPTPSFAPCARCFSARAGPTSRASAPTRRGCNTAPPSKSCCWCASRS